MNSRTLSDLCTPDMLAAVRSARWRPGLAAPLHSEVFASGCEGSGAGLALALACDALRKADTENEAGCQDDRAVLWVQDRTGVRLNGRPYRPGLPAQLQHRLIHVIAEKAEDALFALEEGLRCRDFAFVLGELTGNPKALDFTASRRLSLVAERHGVPLWLVRLDATRDLSSARMRWEAWPAASPSPHWNADAPGIPAWRAELFRARAHAPGQWILYDDGRNLSTAPPHPLDLASTVDDRSLALG